MQCHVLQATIQMKEAKYNKNVIRTKSLIKQQAGWSAAQTTLFLLDLRFSQR
jgi:hypothetical protein